MREDAGLRAVVKPVLHEIGESERLSLLHRISLAATLAATLAVNREHGVTFDAR